MSMGGPVTRWRTHRITPLHGGGIWGRRGRRVSCPRPLRCQKMRLMLDYSDSNKHREWERGAATGRTWRGFLFGGNMRPGQSPSCIMSLSGVDRVLTMIPFSGPLPDNCVFECLAPRETGRPVGKFGDPAQMVEKMGKRLRDNRDEIKNMRRWGHRFKLRSMHWPVFFQQASFHRCKIV